MLKPLLAASLLALPAAALAEAQSGTVELKAVGTRPISDGGKCQPGNDNDRGDLHGHVKFSKPFATDPVVQIALQRLDLGDKEGARIDVTVVGRPSKTGFDYSFKTWCSSVVYRARAGWIAVGG